MTQLVNPLIFAQPTLWSLAITYARPYWPVAGLLMVGAALLALARLWWRDIASARWDSLPLTFLLAVPVAYYAWDYDLVLLLFPWLACWVWAAVGTTRAARLWRYTLMVWILVVPLIGLLPLPPSDADTYQLALPATLLPLYLLARHRHSAQSRSLPLSPTEPGSDPARSLRPGS
jgi:hypothetical protein